MKTFDETAKRRIRFQTRRGLLELDILLGRFMEKEFHRLSDDELTIFVEILDLPDQEFLALVNQKEETDKLHFTPLLEKIRQA
ncbi:FAD assembly factor SdhE [Neisseria weaveri]|uniref:FAD assembly factor SdhE n=1 Tax=Neisseria weaveri TaxID=28091 RepID=A0A3S4Z1K0_9NEIS|nr:succinate dehydrogenase assembly factor 2 [Neisseria weaveri]EGV37246.1 TPR repeat protein [Neisseria weaveri LMG 5135]VEJ49445.1 TPR repeat protein [Neisseria weaveri]